MEKHALYACTRNLYGDMVTSAKSLVANSDVDKIWFFTEDDDFDYYLPDGLFEVVNVSDQEFFPPDSPNYRGWASHMALMRAPLALMPQFKDLDRILTLDADAICLRNVSDIWNMPIEDSYFSASREAVTTFKWMVYCNVGVMLHNLEKLRDGKCQEIVDCLNWHAYLNDMQDVYSFLCQGHIHCMPSEYNVNRFTEPTNVVRIRHYAGDGADFWRNETVVKQYRRMSWDRVMDQHERIVAKRA